MKKYHFILFLFIASFAIMSCSKGGSGSSTVSPIASISFVANGSPYSWNEVTSDRDPNYLLISITGSGGMYYLRADNSFSSTLWPERAVVLSFSAAALAVNTPYTFANTTPSNPFPPHAVVTATTNPTNPAVIYTASEVGDVATVTITSLHNGLADGTFTATLTRRSDQAKVNITGGSFRNVKIN